MFKVSVSNFWFVSTTIDTPEERVPRDARDVRATGVHGAPVAPDSRVQTAPA